MDVDNTFIKPMLLFHFGKGKSEVETHEEISKHLGQYAISLKTINKWFSEFRKSEHSTLSKKPAHSKKKFSDEFLINLIKENPNLSMEKLARLANISGSAISKRIKQINSDGKKVNYQRKSCNKFTDKSLTDLVDKNPDLNMKELAVMLNVSESAVCSRLKQINENGETIRYESKIFQKKKLETSENPCPAIDLTEEFIINLINDNPDLNMKELAKLAGISRFTLSKRIKQINSDGEKVKYHKKRVQKFTDEFLIDLIKNNPELSMEKLAKLANTSQRTISRRIGQLNENDEKSNYCKKIKPRFTDEFLVNLINDNPSFSIEQLAKYTNTSSITISRRIKKINKNGENAVYIFKSPQYSNSEEIYISSPKSKFSDEFLVKLVNENPELGVRELAKLAKVSVKFISKRLKQVNWIDARANYSNGNPIESAKD
jgi:transcriptional antiterminator